MIPVFYIAAMVALAATVLAITRLDAVHALLYLIVSLFAVAIVFYTLGAPFAAALEVIVYAGAIMVLFLFVVMLLNLGRQTIDQERRWMRPAIWIGPSILAAILAAELIYLLAGTRLPGSGPSVIGPKATAAVLLGPYLLGVELASMLLLAGLAGANHLGRRRAAGAEQRKGETS